MTYSTSFFLTFLTCKVKIKFQSLHAVVRNKDECNLDSYLIYYKNCKGVSYYCHSVCSETRGQKGTQFIEGFLSLAYGLQKKYGLQPPLEIFSLYLRMKGKESDVTQSCLSLCDCMDYSLPGSSVQGIFEVIVLEWVSFPSPEYFSPPRYRTQISHISGRLYCLSQVSQSVLLLSHVQISATPWTAAWKASLSITYSWSLLKLMSIELVMPSNHLILCHRLLLPSSIFPSIRVFSNESVLCIREPKYWNFSFSISPSNEYSGLISFRMDWLDLLAVQGTRKSLIQHHSSKASILQRSTFFIVQLSHPYM